ncbi:hypothetical protein GYMLUDRAFT_64167 [Collybiopsis luxurians FD-317 M1]|uniref:Uncharacterized protein n=1 Tax=Collybiopsis luxurians FD-317 M1 TaxID=944289 RepID=A0A0D0BSG2_9AGAR|nr:hypothetical protein GYMLUDRAFT_64167 [Collybiopsis luxurians FD-317 M1]
MLRAKRVLDKHNDCASWRHVVKAHLKNSLYPLHEPRIPLIHGHNGSGLKNVTVDDIFQSTMTKIDSMWNINAHSHSVEVFTEGGTSDNESGHESIMDDSDYTHLEARGDNSENEVLFLKSLLK